jgi:hypothetical protein
MKDKFHIEKHPQWYYDVPEMKYLIIGSFPPHKSKWSYPFFYPNKINHFWKILAAAAGIDLTAFSGENAVIERKAIMRALKTGIINMDKTVCRKGTSAKDTDIIILEYHPVLAIIHAHPALQTIIISGYSAPHSSYNSFVRYLLLNNISFEEPPLVEARSELKIYLTERNLRCVIVNSTSPASFIKPKLLENQFQKIYD